MNINHQGVHISNICLISTEESGAISFCATVKSEQSDSYDFTGMIYTDPVQVTWIDYVLLKDGVLDSEGKVQTDRSKTIDPLDLARQIAEAIRDYLTNNPALD